MMTEPTQSTNSLVWAASPWLMALTWLPGSPLPECWVALDPAGTGMAQSLAQPQQLLHPLMDSMSQPAAACPCRCAWLA